MKIDKILLLFLCSLFFACTRPPDAGNTDQWKEEIRAVEKNFNDLAQKEGIAAAFAFYAAEDGVLNRNDLLISGKQAISEWYQKNSRPNVSLSWKPDFVEVSQSGDLAYTYGHYIYTSVDSTGTSRELTGVFHTVWKRQPDGDWKFVWD